MITKEKQGLVAVDTINNDNDAVLISLTCNTEAFSKSNAFEQLVDMILVNSLHKLPKSLIGVLGIEIEAFKEKYSDCYLIEDAIDKISKEYKENIELDFYHLERINVWRDNMRIICKTSPDNKIAALATFGGAGMSYDSIYKTNIFN